MVFTTCDGKFETPLFYDKANESVLTRGMNAHRLIEEICSHVYGNKSYATCFAFRKILIVFKIYRDLLLKDDESDDSLVGFNDKIILEFDIIDGGDDDYFDESWTEKIHVFRSSGKYLFTLDKDCFTIYDANMENAHS